LDSFAQTDSDYEVQLRTQLGRLRQISGSLEGSAHAPQY